VCWFLKIKATTPDKVPSSLLAPNGPQHSWLALYNTATQKHNPVKEYSSSEKLVTCTKLYDVRALDRIKAGMLPSRLSTHSQALHRK
jgi:hypothetical protein